MNVAISARGLSMKSGGAKEYIKHLILSLSQIDSKNQYTIYYSSSNQQLHIQLANVTETVIPRLPNVLWDHILLPIRLWLDNIDVTVFPKGTIPLLRPAKSIVTIFDLAYFYPGLRAYTILDTIYFKALMPYSIRKSDAVLAISQNTIIDILRFVPGAKSNKIHLTYLAHALSSDMITCESPRHKYNLGAQPYIFISSSLSPRKNIERAIAALAAIKDVVPHNLVITGGKTWRTGDISRIIATHGVQDRVNILGHVPSDDLRSLYKYASLYLMPSLYEGFSITLLEAMELGCPVVASNVSSHPEVVGDAGILFDPYSVESMTDAILQVLSSEPLQVLLRQRGYERARNFSWEKCARETLSVIKQVYASRG